jgi:hypothetical protein
MSKFLNPAHVNENYRMNTVSRLAIFSVKYEVSSVMGFFSFTENLDSA